MFTLKNKVGVKEPYMMISSADQLQTCSFRVTKKNMVFDAVPELSFKLHPSDTGKLLGTVIT